MIRKISAHYIFPADAPPLKRGIVIINEKGEIADLIDTGGALPEISNLEFYDGIITPGFINAHTHLELSNLKGQIPQKTGLINFLKNVGELRNLDTSLTIMDYADSEMQQYGIVAAGDISNTSFSFSTKTKSKIKYFTFIEILGIKDSIASERFSNAKKLWQELQSLSLPSSIAPHAPYSLSDSLWKILLDFSKTHNLIWTIHNQENINENRLFVNKTGDFVEFLNNLSDEFSKWQPKGVSSLKYCRAFYEQISKVLLVHNTFTDTEDLELISHLKNTIFFVLCPNANLYIEDCLPNIEQLRNTGHRIALGTDSLASNTKLSILEEMKTIQQHFPQISLQELIDWATINGATALGFDDQLGSLKKGKTPGLNLITKIDFQKMALTSQSQVKVL